MNKMQKPLKKRKKKGLTYKDMMGCRKLDEFFEQTEKLNEEE